MYFLLWILNISTLKILTLYGVGAGGTEPSVSHKLNTEIPGQLSQQSFNVASQYLMTL